MPTILLVDDESIITESLTYSLTKEGYTVHTAADGQTALQLFNEVQPDIVLLDIRLPGIDGLEVCRRLRAISPVPIIMLTAIDNELDRIIGLELGADDYIPKPFSFRELLARIRAVLRRVALDQQTTAASTLQVRDLSVDRGSRRVFKQDREIQLSAREYDLLVELMAHMGHAISRENLILTVWGTEWRGDPRTLEVHIRWLRLKIEDDPTGPRYIQTVRGYGYRFASPDELE